MPELKFHRGDPVQFKIGTRIVVGKVKEDRGPIGVKGRHLYLVEFRFASQTDSHSLIELPAEQLQAATDGVSVK